MFAPCEESDSRMVLLLNARGIERSSHGMSVQPDILICVSTLPPSRDGGLLAHAQAEPLHVAFS